MAELFWFSDEQWAVIEPFMPTNQPGARREDDQRVISGIVHALRSGCRWRDCPSDYGPHTTVYNRFSRRSRRGFWRAMLAALAEGGDPPHAWQQQQHAGRLRCARPGTGRLLADRGYERAERRLSLDFARLTVLRC